MSARGVWFNSEDGAFHYQRYLEIGRALSHFKLPAFDTQTFPYGLATDVFYPWLTSVPFAFVLKLFRDSPVGLYAVLALILFSGLESAYFSAGTWRRDYKYQFWFAVLDVMCGNTVYKGLEMQDFGELTALVFLPVAYFGFLNWLHGGRWRMLAIGMSLVVWSHLPTAVLTGLLFTIWSLVRSKSLADRHHLVPLGLAVVTALVLTAVYWIPALEISRTGVVLPRVLVNTDRTFGNWMIIYAFTFAVWFGLVSAERWQRFSSYDKQAYVISVGLLLFMLPYPNYSMAWLAETPLRNLQLQSIDRLAGITTLILAALGSGLLSGRFGRTSLSDPHLKAEIITALFICTAGFFGMNSFGSDRTESWRPQRPYRTQAELNADSYYDAHQRPKLAPSDNVPCYALSNRRAYSTLVYGSDYAPRASRKYLARFEHGSSGDHRVKIRVLRGSLIFRPKRNYRRLILPAVGYRSQKYRVEVNGRGTEKWKLENGCFTIYDVGPRTYRIKIST